MQRTQGLYSPLVLCVHPSEMKKKVLLNPTSPRQNPDLQQRGGRGGEMAGFGGGMVKRSPPVSAAAAATGV